VRVERLTAADTWPLRHAVLRPHQDTDEIAGAEHPLAAHLGARDEQGRIVGVARIAPEAPPWDPQRADAWRLRGMATAEAARGRGVGAEVLAAALEHAARHGGRSVWCSARVPALRFYERAGFRAAGERYEDPELGPHVPLERDLDGGGDG
jgi:predicted GNAT family N-acyltransferase